MCGQSSWTVRVEDRVLSHCSHVNRLHSEHRSVQRFKKKRGGWLLRLAVGGGAWACLKTTRVVFFEYEMCGCEERKKMGEVEKRGEMGKVRM